MQQSAPGSVVRAVQVRACMGTDMAYAIASESQCSEQSGFANLIKGTFGMFRNPSAHEARILWAMGKEDAEDLLSLASLIHRRLDAAK